MKPEKFMQAMGGIKPEIVEELAEEESKAPAAKKKAFKFTRKKLVGFAACFVFIIALTIMIPFIKPQINGLILNHSKQSVWIDDSPFSRLSMFVYGDTLYFSNPNDNYYLYSCNINNPSQSLKKISNTKFSFRGVKTDGENIYSITGSGSGEEKICSANLSGKDLKTLYEDKDIDPHQNSSNLSYLSLYKNKLYFISQYTTWEDSTKCEHHCLMCYDINTKSIIVLKQFDYIPPKDYGDYRIPLIPTTYYTIYNDTIYLAEGQLYTCNLDGSNEKVLVETQNNDSIGNLQIKNEKLYYQIFSRDQTYPGGAVFVRSDLDGKNKVSTDIIKGISGNMSVLDNGYVVCDFNGQGLSLIDIDKSSVINSYQDLVPWCYLTAGNKIFALKKMDENYKSFESFGMYEDGKVEYILTNDSANSSN